VAGLVLGPKGVIVDTTGGATANFWGALGRLFAAVNAVSNNGFPTLPAYTVAELTGGNPSAAKAGARALAYCSNATGGARPVYSDGTHWLDCRNGNVIS
jgi:hypothetical protein